MEQRLCYDQIGRAVERMFSIAGQIFQYKKRRMSSKLFTALVVTKLNENFYNLKKN